VPSKIVIAQQQGNETNMIPMGKMVQNMTEEQLSKQIMQTTMDEIKKDNPMHADLIDKIPSMTLEEAVKNLLVLEDIEQVLKAHIQDLIEGNQTNG
jgi:RecG-like helicase